MTTAERVSVVIPVYNEAENIGRCLRAVAEALRGIDHEILVCYDFDQDTTLGAVAAMPDRPPTLRLVKNTLGRGAAFALRAGMLAAEGDVVVTMMADLSDPPEVIPAMAREIRAGADVVSGSRYMKGGRQEGGPPLKRFLSRAAGLSLRWIAGLGTHDATNNFRAYRRDFLRSVAVESTAGFELALELTVKAHLGGRKVAEVPTRWTDRVAGESRFRLWAWMPRYLRWYGRAMAGPLFAGAVLLVLLGATAAVAWSHAPALPVLDEWVHVPRVVGDEPLTFEWLWSSHNDHRIPLPKLAGQGLARLFGMEGRWESVTNVLLLGAAAAVLLAALRRFRGRLIWTDACIPMLLLNWAQWENFAWPWQIAFVLVVLLVAVFIATFLKRPGDAAGGRGLVAAAILLLLPLCGAPALPLAAALAAWWVAAGPRPRLGLRAAAAGAALVLAGLYFVGYEKQPELPPPPDLPLLLAVAAQALGAGLGHVGETTWPASGFVVLAGTAVAAFLLVEAWRRRPASRVPAGVLLAAMAGFVGVAVAVAYGRGAGWPLAGFTSRYATLTALAPFILYAAAEITERPRAARAVRIGLFALLAAVCAPNALRAWVELGSRRHFNDSLTRDVRRGLPLALIASRHRSAWYHKTDGLFERGLRGLARERMAIYRRIPPPAPSLLDAAAEQGAGFVELSDGRIAVETRPSARFVFPMGEGRHRVSIRFGARAPLAGEVVLAGQFVPDGREPLQAWTEGLAAGAAEERQAVFACEGPGELTIEVRGGGMRDRNRVWWIPDVSTEPRSR